jgi:rRNA processing protein Krr1/Pno1
MAAARVLGGLNEPEVSRRLIEMVLRGAYRQEALVALLSSSEDSARRFLENAEREVSLAATLWNAKRQFQNSSQWRS